jgi:hypothetical protein
MIHERKLLYIQQASPICTSSPGHSHLYVLELQISPLVHVFALGSHGSHKFSPPDIKETYLIIKTIS